MSVEDMLFVFLVMQTVITTTFFSLGSIDKWISFLCQMTLSYICRSVINFLFFLVTQQKFIEHNMQETSPTIRNVFNRTKTWYLALQFPTVTISDTVR